jgi:pimeloyl-ACP methyl ester carboxylesterase/DNA-binding CsgD family transcriptional regulator
MTATTPQTHYATAERNVHVAYQVFGGGTHDLVFVPPFVSNVDVWWELPAAARFFNRLGSFARVILLDKRGTGLSDRLSTVETPEERMDDIRAVMDAVDSREAAIFGASEGVPIAILFAATHPERTTDLLLWGGMARWSPSPDYPWSLTDEMYAGIVELSASKWGTGFSAQLLYPSGAEEPGVRQWFAHYERVSASPGGFATITLNNTALDVRSILPSIQARTLLVHADGDTFVHVGGSRYLATHITGAKYVELVGMDHLFCGENADRLAEEVEEFLTGTRQATAEDRMLSTVLVVEVVAGSAAEGRLSHSESQRRTPRLMEAAKDEVRKQRGRAVGTSAGQLVATFDGPARGIHCARSIVQAAGHLEIPVRAGLHTGECLERAGKISGIAIKVAMAARDKTKRGEIAVTSVVRDLVAGSGIEFEQRGEFRVRGVPSVWSVLIVRDSRRAPAPDLGANQARDALEAAVALAVGGPTPGAAPPLSKRETEVALLVGRGMTNRQIASRLYLAERTVEWHVEQILSKLDLTNRVQVANWISQQTTGGRA